MSGDRIHLRSTAFVAGCLVIIGLAGFGALLIWQSLGFVLLPFALAILLTALLEPVAVFMKTRLHVPNVLAAILTVLLTIALVVGLFAFVAPQVASQTSTMAEQAKDGITHLPAVLRDMGIKDAAIQDAIESGTEKLKNDMGNIAGHVGAGVVSVASLVTSIVGGLLLVLMMLIYMLMDGRGFWNGLLKFLPADRQKGWEEGGQRAWNALKLFIRGQVLVSAIDGIGVGVGLAIVGVDMAMALGVMTFVFSLIPTVGAIIAGAISALVALSSNGVSGFTWAIIITIVVQQVEGNILYPIMIGRSLSLHPLAVLLGVGAGTALLGIVGSFLATPIMAGIAAGMGWLHEEDDSSDDGEASPPGGGAHAPPASAAPG